MNLLIVHLHRGYQPFSLQSQQEGLKSGGWEGEFNSKCEETLAMIPTADASEVSGWWGTWGKVPRSSMRCSVINGAVFFPLQEHSKFQETNQKPKMINCVIYNESCCVCLWIPLLCRSDIPGAEKHLAMMNPLNFLVTKSKKGKHWFCLRVDSRKGIKAGEKTDMVEWEQKHPLTPSQATIISLAFLLPF